MTASDAPPRTIIGRTALTDSTHCPTNRFRVFLAGLVHLEGRSRQDGRTLCQRHPNSQRNQKQPAISTLLTTTRKKTPLWFWSVRPTDHSRRSPARHSGRAAKV